MSDKGLREKEARMRRVRRLKGYLIAALTMGISIPVVLCFVSLLQLKSVQSDLKMLSAAFTILEEQLADSRLELERLRGSTVPSRKGEAEEAQEEPVAEEQSEEEEDFKKKVYITFDDGPSTYTKEILDILDSYQVKATFFVVGKEEDWAQEALRDIVDRGHSLGMHSYGHKYSELYESLDSFAADFDRQQKYLYEVTGVECRIYRFPGGSSNQVSKTDMRELFAFLEERNVVYYDWNVSSRDASGQRLSAETIVQNVMRDVGKQDTSMILFHDASDRRTTVEALPTVIEKILEMENVEILPITEATEPIQHIN